MATRRVYCPNKEGCGATLYKVEKLVGDVYSYTFNPSTQTFERPTFKEADHKISCPYCGVDLTGMVLLSDETT